MRNKQRLYIQKLVKLFDGIVIDPVKGVILTPKKKRQVEELRKIGRRIARSRTKKPRI